MHCNSCMLSDKPINSSTQGCHSYPWNAYCKQENLAIHVRKCMDRSLGRAAIQNRKKNASTVAQALCLTFCKCVKGMVDLVFHLWNLLYLGIFYKQRQGQIQGGRGSWSLKGSNSGTPATHDLQLQHKLFSKRHRWEVWASKGSHVVVPKYHIHTLPSVAILFHKF